MARDYTSFVCSIRPRLMRQGSYLGLNRADAEDAAQMTVWDSWRHWSDWQHLTEGEQEANCLQSHKCMVRRIWRAEGRQQVPRQRQPACPIAPLALKSMPQIFAQDAIDWENVPASDDWSLQESTVADLIARLPLRQRQVLYLSVIGGLTNEAIAHGLGIAGVTVATHKMRGLTALRDLYE